VKKEETKDPTRLNSQGGGGKAVPRGTKEVTPEKSEKKGPQSSEKKVMQKRGNSSSK